MIFFSYVVEIFYLIILAVYVNFDLHNQLFFLHGVFSHNFDFLSHYVMGFFSNVMEMSFRRKCISAGK